MIRQFVPHLGLELNVGGSTVSAALRDTTGVTKVKMREMYSKMGDLGNVAQVAALCTLYYVLC